LPVIVPFVCFNYARRPLAFVQAFLCQVYSDKTTACEIINILLLSEFFCEMSALGIKVPLIVEHTFIKCPRNVLVKRKYY